MIFSKEEKAKVMNEFGKHASDTGSSEVQVALLTKEIDRLTEHCKVHTHDFSTKRGLLRMVNRRRRFLQYLQKTSFATYKSVIERLGLRK